MARNRRRRSRGEAWKFAAGGLVIVVCLALIAAYAGLMWSVSDRPVLVAETLCPEDGPRAVTVILLDASDDLPDVTRQQVRQDLTDRAETLQEYALLELRLLDPTVPGGRVVFSKCNPGDGSNLNELIGNPVLARRRWLEQFRKPLDAALDGSLEPGPADTSPILETLQRIAIDRFAGRNVAAIPKSLVIISDMLEHTPLYSQYRDGLSYISFKESGAYKRVRTDLHDAAVEIEYVQRLTNRPLDTGQHIQFWIDWVRDNNGAFDTAEKLQGAG